MLNRIICGTYSSYLNQIMSSYLCKLNGLTSKRLSLQRYGAVLNQT